MGLLKFKFTRAAFKIMGPQDALVVHSTSAGLYRASARSVASTRWLVSVLKLRKRSASQDSKVWGGYSAAHMAMSYL